MFVIQKLRYYTKVHTVQMISKANPIKYILPSTLPSEQLAKWAIILK